jgi:hypothetical protein
MLSLDLLMQHLILVTANLDTQVEAGKSVLTNGEDIQKHRSCLGRLCFCCAIFTMEDCHKEDEANQDEDDGEESLFCTLCNAEVLMLRFNLIHHAEYAILSSKPLLHFCQHHGSLSYKFTYLLSSHLPKIYYCWLQRNRMAAHRMLLQFQYKKGNAVV